MTFIRFIHNNILTLNLMMERAGMSEMDIYNRTRDVFLHYKLPFDSPPPVGSATERSLPIVGCRRCGEYGDSWNYQGFLLELAGDVVAGEGATDVAGG
jgi:hypothetical protein